MKRKTTEELLAELLDRIIDSLSKYNKTEIAITRTGSEDVITVGTLIYILSQEAERLRVD